jgi:hypothetical protein
MAAATIAASCATPAESAPAGTPHAHAGSAAEPGSIRSRPASASLCPASTLAWTWSRGRRDLGTTTKVPGLKA